MFGSLYIAYGSAYGSVCELETQVLLSGDLNYVNKENLKALKDAQSVDKIVGEQTLGPLTP